MYTSNTLFLFYKNHFYKNVEVRFAPKIKKIYGLKLEHLQAQPNYTRSYKKRVFTMYLSNLHSCGRKEIKQKT